MKLQRRLEEIAAEDTFVEPCSNAGQMTGFRRVARVLGEREQWPEGLLREGMQGIATD